MRTITRRRPHHVTETRTRRGMAADGPVSPPRLRPQLVSDAVIAGYIHDISVRHRPQGGDMTGQAFASSDLTHGGRFGNQPPRVMTAHPARRTADLEDPPSETRVLAA